MKVLAFGHEFHTFMTLKILYLHFSRVFTRLAVASGYAYFYILPRRVPPIWAKPIPHFSLIFCNRRLPPDANITFSLSPSGLMMERIFRLVLMLSYLILHDHAADHSKEMLAVQGKSLHVLV